EHYRDRIDAFDILRRLDLAPRGYFIASLHREENVDSRARLLALIEALEALAVRFGRPGIISTPPPTRQRLESPGRSLDEGALRFLKPFGFHDYNHLQMHAFCAISDSGTIAEESSILGFPAITPRDAIERPEALDTGSILMTGLDRDTILAGVEAVTRFFAERGGRQPVPQDYCITNTSERVVSLILGTARLSNAWDGIRPNDVEDR